ncbi:MAG: hypothetical protein WC379_01465 [Methanoregula sp.]|jgi:hypothetical protein
MKKYIWLFLIFALFIPTVAADGMAFTGDWQLFNLQPEKEQAGAIFYENGYENMLLSVSLDWNITGNQSVWIFPVPAAPEDTTIDLLKGYPYLHGENLDGEYYGSIGKVLGTAAAYALFPLSGLAPGAFNPYQHSGGALSADIQPDVQVYQHVEKMGLTSELVTAQDADAIERYLSIKGIILPAASKETLNEYTGKKYSFVITSISNVTEFRSQFQVHDTRYDWIMRNDILSVFVRFPTDRIYFPLKLTSAYGSRIIPITITVNEWVTPIVTENILAGEPISMYPVEIRGGTVTTYFTQSTDWGHTRSEYISPPLRQFTNGRESIPAIYTKVQIHSPSNNFTDDLWFDNKPPFDVTIKDLIVRNPVPVGIPIFVILSMLASLIAGIIVFRDGPVSKTRLMMHGLWNCATVIGFVYATRQRLNLPNNLVERKKRFVIIFYTVFLILLSLFGFLLIPHFIFYIPRYFQLFILSVPLAAFYSAFSHIYENVFTCFLYGHIDLLYTVREQFITVMVTLICNSALVCLVWGMDGSLNVKNRDKIPVFILSFTLLAMAIVVIPTSIWYFRLVLLDSGELSNIVIVANIALLLIAWLLFRDRTK